MPTMFETIALLFIFFLIGTIFYGYSLIMRRLPSREELRSERCSICRQTLPKDELVERTIGDHKVLFFCSLCIAGLVRDEQKRPAHGKADVSRLFTDAGEKHRTN